jgi:hypothetical protein
MRSYALAITLAFLATLAALCWDWRGVHRAEPSRDVAALADSLRRVSTASRDSFAHWSDSIIKAPPRVVLRSVIHYIFRHDTSWMARAAQDTAGDTDMVEIPGIKDSALKWFAVSDSGHHVKEDSLGGVIVLRDVELGQCRDSLSHAPDGYWRGFRMGTEVGAVGGVTTCAVGVYLLK